MAISFEDSLRLNVSPIVDFKNKTPSQTQIPSVLNKNTIKVAYSEGSDNWTQVSDKGYEFYEDYTDDNYCIIDIDKSVTLTPSQINITQEANSQYIPFMMPRYYDGFDLSSTKLQIYYVNRLDEYGIDHPVNVYYNDEKIKFAWLVDNNATSVDGKLSFEIQAVGTNSKSEPYTWKSKINNDMNILKSLSGSRMVEPSNEWQEEFLSVINGKLTLATDAANDAVSAITTVESLVANAEAAAESASAIADNIMNTIHDDVKAAVDDALSDLDIGDYILTDADKIEIAELAAGLVEVPDVPSGGENALYVTVTKSADGVTTADKTFDEIRSAFTENRAVFCVYTDHTPIGSFVLQTTKHVILPLCACNETVCAFYHSVIMSIDGESVTIQGNVFFIGTSVTADIVIAEYATKDDIPDGGIDVTGATVGQTVKISAVDETGKPTAWEPADFPGVGIGNNVANSDPIPAYIQAEAERVAAVVQSRQNANTITFLACSDIHYYSPDNATANTNAAHMKEAVVSMGQAMGIIRERCHIDFAAMFGDMVWENGETKDELLDEMRFVNACLHTGFSGIPQFRMEGNHDDGYENDTPLTTGELFANIGAWNDNAVYGNREYGYCYRDFEDVKLRVISLNSSENYSGSGFMTSTEQVTWLTNALNLSNKGADWRSIILSHHPLDWGKAGGKNPVDVIKTSTGLIASFHGHIHNFLSGTVTDTELPRIAIPNAGYSRENQYGETYGVNWKEGTTYSKTHGTAENTSFCVITIDLAARRIYADHYGAGYDRIIPYDGATVITHTVTNNLTNVSNSNASTVVEEGKPYSATLTADKGYTLESVTVTMGGSSVAVSGGSIDISSVTGDIVITATAVRTATGGNDKNLVTRSIDPATGEVYNGCGYKDGVYGSGAGEGSTAAPDFVLTGLIAYGNDRTAPIYIMGADVDTSNSRCRILGFTSSREVSFQSASGNNISTYFNVDIIDVVDKYYMLTPTSAFKTATGFTDYLRFSLIGEGKNLIITIDEPIE